MHAASTHRVRRIAAAALAALALAACGEAAEDDVASDDPTAQAPADEAPAGETIEVVGVDYGFEGLPATVPVGSTLTFRNDSGVEAHEMVVFRIADGEERPIAELIELPEDEAQSAMAFTGVAFAMPEAEGTGMGGGPGTVEITEAGRYALVCHLPTGADPVAVEEAMSGTSDGPPDLGDGAPHFVEGMVTEFTAS